LNTLEADMGKRKQQLEEEEESPQVQSQSFSKGKKKVRVEEEEEEEEESAQDVGQSQVTMSQAQKSAQELPADDLDRKVKAIVRMALFHERQRTTLKREEISKNVLKDTPRIFAYVFNAAQEKLRQVFGLELVELPVKDKKVVPGKKQPTTMASGTSKQYVLRNLLKAEVNQLINWRDELPKMGLLYVILSLILMSGDHVLTEESLWHHLKTLRVYKDKDHPLFGEPDKIITQYVKENFIVKNKVVTNNQETFEFRWGPRARVEVSAESIVEFISEIYGEEADNNFKKELKKQAGIQKAGGASSQTQQTQEIY